MSGLIAGRELHNGSDYSERNNMRHDLPSPQGDGRSVWDGSGQGSACEAAEVRHLPQDHGGEAAASDHVHRITGWHDDHQG